MHQRSGPIIRMLMWVATVALLLGAHASAPAAGSSARWMLTLGGVCSAASGDAADNLDTGGERSGGPSHTAQHCPSCHLHISALALPPMAWFGLWQILPAFRVPTLPLAWMQPMRWPVGHKQPRAPPIAS